MHRTWGLAIRTSAIIILRKALAIDASTPTRSNSTDLCDSRFTSTLRFYIIRKAVSDRVAQRVEPDVPA